MDFRSLRRALAAASLSVAACLPAQASLVDFEDVIPTLFSGSAISSGGMTFASTGSGFSGVDSAAAFSVFANAPVNSNGQFLFGLNGDGLTMAAEGGEAFRLLGFDASFIAPIVVAAGLSAGQLHLNGIALGGQALSEFFDLGLSDADGNFGFAHYFVTALGSEYLTSVTFTACLYLEDGSCSFAGDQLFPQFALDNIQVPEPGTAALAILALGCLAARRRQSV